SSIIVVVPGWRVGVAARFTAGSSSCGEKLDACDARHAERVGRGAECVVEIHDSALELDAWRPGHARDERAISSVAIRQQCSHPPGSAGFARRRESTARCPRGWLTYGWGAGACNSGAVRRGA